jgi:hypothetical protein
VYIEYNRTEQRRREREMCWRELFLLEVRLSHVFRQTKNGKKDERKKEEDDWKRKNCFL